MKYHTTHIDKYLNGELSQSEVKAFEEEMKVDKDFAYEVELQDAAIQVIQYPNFMREIKNVRNEIAVEDENPTLNQQIKDKEAPTTDSQKERETPVIKTKSKRSLIIRRLLTIAASLLLIAVAYFLLPQNPMADTTQVLADKAISQTKGNDTPTTMTLYQQSVKLFESGEYESAIKLFDQVIQEDADKRAAAKFFKADALHRLGRKDEVRAVLESIEKDAPLYDKAQTVLKKYK